MAETNGNEPIRNEPALLKDVAQGQGAGILRHPSTASQGWL